MFSHKVLAGRRKSISDFLKIDQRLSYTRETHGKHKMRPTSVARQQGLRENNVHPDRQRVFVKLKPTRIRCDNKIENLLGPGSRTRFDLVKTQ